MQRNLFKCAGIGGHFLFSFLLTLNVGGVEAEGGNKAEGSVVLF